MLSYSRRAKTRSRFWTHLAKRWKACMLASCRIQPLTWQHHCITFFFLVFVSSAACWCLGKGNRAAVPVAELEITQELAVSYHPLGTYKYILFTISQCSCVSFTKWSSYQSSIVWQHSPLLGLSSLAAEIIKHGYLEQCSSWCLWANYVE